MLNHGNLLRYGGELLFEQSVEFIEATPRTAFYESHKDSTHAFEVNTFVAVEH